MSAVVCKLYDLASTELADISYIAFEPSMTVGLNQSTSFTLTCPAGHTLLTTVAGDGYPNLRWGNRKLVVWENGTVIFHGRIFAVERNGNGTENLVTITAYDPYMELGFDSEDKAGRPVRAGAHTGGDGNLITPRFFSSVDGGAAISGPDMILQVLDHSTNTDPTLGEGALPIDPTGSFDLNVPPAVDLSCLDSMDWPLLIGDFIAQLVATNVVDFKMTPLEPGAGLSSYSMVELSAVSSLGSDRSGTVHFDYWTGAKNAAQCRHLGDFSTINNKLFYYLGPRGQDLQHWAGSIAPDSPGVVPDPTASRALYGGPDGGQFMSIKVFDSIGTENSNRPIYLALFNAELNLRVEPRELLYITPAQDAKALYQPPHDFDVGDVIAINVGADFGLTLAESQRVYGYTRSWTREGVASVSELLTSADPP